MTNDGHDTSTQMPAHRLGAVLLAVLLLTAVPGAMTTASAAQTASGFPAEPAFLVALEPDGSAQTTVTVVFDLTTDSERAAFEAFRANATAREQRTRQFASRMRTIADRTQGGVDREMRITEPSIEFVVRNDTGIVALSVTWEGLAARSGDALVLGEPFRSGFAIDRAFYVFGPDGYAIEAASPTPTRRTSAMAMWAAGTSLDGFQVRFGPADGTAGAVTGDTPGFTAGVALLALLLVAANAIARTRR